MESEKIRAEILVSGLVQGVGYRYFVQRTALALGLTGYVKNLYTGEVFAVVEGKEYLVEDLIAKMRIGPQRSDVRGIKVSREEYKGEFRTFEIRY